MSDSTALPDPLLSALSALLTARLGCHFPRERRGDLERAIAAMARENGFPDSSACLLWLLREPWGQGQIDLLVHHLTVGETYFFRDSASFAALDGRILPDLLARTAASRPLRIWSAGCATGEEPYSIAIVLDRLLPETIKERTTILATDINPNFLRKAMEGVYGPWSFRGTPESIRKRYFVTIRDGRFQIKPQLRRRVSFAYLNLADDLYPSLATHTHAMDLIFCRNVLMYFDSDKAERVVARLHRALAEGGWLMVSPVEASARRFASFRVVPYPGAILYQKLPDGEGPVANAAGPAAPAVAAPVPSATHQASTQQVGTADVLSPRQGAEALRRLARAHADRGQLEAALEWCEKAVDADKLDPASHYLLATVQQERSDYGAAIRALERALYLDPGFVLAHFTLGNLRASQRRLRDARRHFRNALSLLRERPAEEVLPESGGLTCGRLAEIIAAMGRALSPEPTEG